MPSKKSSSNLSREVQAMVVSRDFQQRKKIYFNNMVKILNSLIWLRVRRYYAHNDDLYQDCLIKLWECLDTYDSRKSDFLTYYFHTIQYFIPDKFREYQSIGMGSGSQLRKNNYSPEHVEYVETTPYMPEDFTPFFEVQSEVGNRLLVYFKGNQLDSAIFSVMKELDLTIAETASMLLLKDKRVEYTLLKYRKSISDN